MTLRRIVPIAMIVAMLCASTPAPVSAGLSTGGEVQIGQDEDQAIVEETNVVSDPLLNAWVNGITTKLWRQTARKDVPYTVKILDVGDVNAFSTLGGFVYVNVATLDFVQSDDELAGVLGHETGHIERRHAVTMNNKANLISLVLGLGSLFSPFIYQFGQLIQAGAVAQISRDDEYQADKYGLMLMSRAGYDPDAMVSFMRHLGAVAEEHNGLLDKYLADHPTTPARVHALEGYPELDPKVRTTQQRLAAAIRNEDAGRYAVAARDFGALLQSDPDDKASIEYHLGVVQLALGDTAEGERNLAQAASDGAGDVKAAAEGRLQALRASAGRTAAPADLAALRAAVADARAKEKQVAAALEARRASGRAQFKTLQTRIEDIVYAVPNLGSFQRRAGSRIDTLIHNVATMGRALDTATEKATDTMAGIGTLTAGKPGGLLKDDADILQQLAAPIAADEVPAKAVPALPLYPRILADLSAADADMIRSIDAARAELAMLDGALTDLDKFVRELDRARLEATGDVQVSDYHTLEPLMIAATDSLNKAAVAGSQAEQLYELARSYQLEARIDLLGLSASPERYASLTRVLDARFGNGSIDYAALQQLELSPGEVAAAAIIAADTNTTPAAIVAEARTTHRSVVDIANARGMQAQALEIFLGLIYLSYTDDPEKEAHPDADSPKINGGVT